MFVDAAERLIGTATPGHALVGDEHVEHAALQDRQSLLHAERALDDVFAPEHALHEIQNVLFIVDHEEPLHPLVPFARPCALAL